MVIREGCLMFNWELLPIAEPKCTLQKPNTDTKRLPSLQAVTFSKILGIHVFLLLAEILFFFFPATPSPTWKISLDSNSREFFLD